MKQNTNISAIHKNLFFGIGFVLFASLVLMLNWLLNLPVKQADVVEGQLAKTEQQIQLLQSMQNEFILRFEKADDLFSDEKGLSQQQVNTTLESIRHDLKLLRDVRFVRHHAELAASLDAQLMALNAFEGDLKDFILASLERGSESSGLIAQWRGVSTRMYNASLADGPEISRLAEKIKNSETGYLLHNDLKTADDLLAAAGEIRNKLVAKENGIKAADLNTYIALTTNLITLNKRIGSDANQGIRASTAKSLEVLLTTSENSSRLMDLVCQKIRFIWTILLYVIVALVTIAGIGTLIIITTQGITRPLTSAITFLHRLVAGEVPSQPLTVEGIVEISQIGTSLNDLVKELQIKTDFARSLNENNLDVRFVFSGPNDILGRELHTLQQKMKDTAELQGKNDDENAKRRYINEGLAQFAEILRTRSNDIHLLGDAFIREIVKYLNAIQGGFFMLSENKQESQVLDLVSAFAYNRKKFLQKSLTLGEGLVGTCAREKQIINLTELPEGYISITSGLGDAKPENLLLVPVLHEDELIGVLEIASLNRFKDHEIQFAREVAGSLGSTIIYARNNQRTSELLSKSQEQALEMAEQEEEMRQNMEELKATQEESSRREEEFRGIAEAIGKSLYVIEYNLDGIIKDVNDKFCIFLGKSHDEITGKQHHEVMTGSLVTDASFWEELQRNNHVTVVETIKIGKKQHNLKEHFAQVINRDGIAVRYVNFMTDITH
jgi:PAS domain S-box-containing protein